MFWKRNAPPPSDPPPSNGPPAKATSGGHPAVPDPLARETDAAIDTVVALLRAFGEHAFDTDNVPAEGTRAESDGWARRIAMGEKLGVEGGPPKRDFGGARRYFAAHRAHER